MNYEEKIDELIKFEDGEISLDVKVSPNKNTVWLTKDDIALLFSRNRTVISKHIKNIYNEKMLDFATTCAKVARVLPDGKKYNVDIYNLDIILAVSYKVNAKKGIHFKQWANSILKQYLLNGHVINEERCLACSTNILSLQNKVEIIKAKRKNI